MASLHDKAIRSNSRRRKASHTIARSFGRGKSDSIVREVQNTVNRRPSRSCTKLSRLYYFNAKLRMDTTLM